jgi:cold shock CspA family protein
MQTGTIIRYQFERPGFGFGFIASEDRKKIYYFRTEKVTGGPLRVGARVTFDVESVQSFFQKRLISGDAKDDRGLGSHRNPHVSWDPRGRDHGKKAPKALNVVILEEATNAAA